MRATTYELILELDDDLFEDLNEKSVECKLVGRVNETSWSKVVFDYDTEYDLIGRIDVIESVGPVYSVILRCSTGPITSIASVSKILLEDEKRNVFDEFTELSGEEKSSRKHSAFSRSQEYWLQFKNSYKQPISKCESLSVILHGSDLGDEKLVSNEMELEYDFFLDAKENPTYFVRTRQLGKITGMQIFVSELTSPWLLEEVAVERLIRHGIDAEKWEDRQTFYLIEEISEEAGIRGIDLGSAIKPKSNKSAVKNDEKSKSNYKTNLDLSRATPPSPSIIRHESMHILPPARNSSVRLSRSASRASTVKAYQSPKFQPNFYGYRNATRVNFDTASLYSYGSTVCGDFSQDEDVTYLIRITTEKATNFNPDMTRARIYGSDGTTKRLKLASHKEAGMFATKTDEKYYTKGRPVGKIEGIRLYYQNAQENSEWAIKNLSVTDQANDQNDWQTQNLLLSGSDLNGEPVDFGKITPTEADPTSNENLPTRKQATIAQKQQMNAGFEDIDGVSTISSRLDDVQLRSQQSSNKYYLCDDF